MSHVDRSDRKHTATDALRREAERRVLERESAQAALPSEAEVRAMVHELQVHQIELEMQNEELVRVHAVAEEASRKYADLFDFAPIGYFVWDDRTTIQELNLAGAALLGLDRSATLNKRFGQFVSVEDLPSFNELCRRALTTEVKQTCEVRLLQGERTLDVLIETQAHPYGAPEQKLCLATVVDISERKRAEQLLRESEARARLLMDSIPAYISYVDADERYHWVNRSYEQLFSRPRGEIIGRTIAEIQQADHYQNMQPYVRQALAGRTVQYENTVTNQQGSTQSFDTNYVPHAADDGTILGFFVLVFDVTKRKLIELSLRLTQFSIDHAVDSVFWVGPDAEILYVNDAACRTLGYAREEIVGKTVPEIDPNFPAEAWPAHWEEIRQRKSFSFESDHYTKTGKLIHTEVTVNYLVFEGREYNCAMMRNITERKEAEVHLSKLAAIVTSSVDAIMSKTLDGIITSWNESATRLFGYSEAEMIGAPVTRLFPPDRLDEEADILRRILAGTRVEHLETVRLKRDGTPVHVSVTISPIKNAAGRIIGASKIVRDITERKRAEDALRESEQRFQAFMNQSPVVAWLKDENFAFRYVNYALEQLFNLPADQILGRTDYELYDKEDADVTRANDERVLLSDTILQDIEQVKGADGRMRQWLVQKFPLRRTGHPTWTGGTAVDVTDRREAENQLLESNERFRLLFEGANDAIFWADADTGLLIECNRAAETLLGRERDEIIGQSHTFLHPPEDALRNKEIFEAHANAQPKSSIEIDVLRKDGRRVAVSISPAVTTIGGKQILQGIFRDITERRDAEAAIREGDRNYSALFEQAAIGVGQLNSITGRFLRVNTCFCKMLGYTPAELLQLDFQTITHPDDLQEDLDNMARLIAGEQRTFQMNKRLLRKDGDIVWVRLTVVPLWAENSPVTCHLSFIEDITQLVLADAERRQAEQELRRSEERFSRLYAASPVSILVATYPEGKIVEVNDAFLQLFSYERDDVLGKSTTEIKIWADIKDREIMLEHLRRDGCFRNKETVFRTKLGETRTVLFSVEHIQLDGRTHSLATSIDITARKQAEESLRKSEERYELVVRGLNDGIWDWNLLTDEEFHSPRWNEILGYDESVVPVHSSFVDLIHPADLATVKAAIRGNFERNERYEVELRLRHKDGSYRWILTRGETVRNAAGQPIRMVGSITDISERKQAEQALRDSEYRYRTFIDTCTDSVFLIDTAGNIRSANPAATRMNGYTLDELLKMNIRDLDDPAIAQLAPERLRRIQAGESLRFEVVHLRKDGTSFPLEVHTTPVNIGNEVFVLAFARDISERKQAEQALRDSEQRYRSFIENCADSVYLLDTAGNIRSANPAAARMHGYTLDELLRMNIRDLNNPANAPLVPERLHRIQAGGALQFETVHQRKDGTSFTTEVRATPVSIGNENFILAFDRDISERKRSEDQTNLLREELAYTSRLVTLREMASGLAHELNQPLAAMSLYVGSAVEFAAQYDSRELNECMRRISEQLQHTGEIIRSMRTFAGRGKSQREFININLLIEDVMTLLAGEFKRSNTAITLELNVAMYPVLANGIQIKQVLVNLIRNALEEMSACEGCERKLIIGTEFEQNQVRVSVTDTGPGLDPAITNRLFLPFQTTKPDGLGMGLAICRTLIEALGGRIGVRSSSGSGTTFFFELPRSVEPMPL